MGLKTVGSEFLVNTTTNSYQLHPDITALAGGGFVVTWDDPSGIGGDPDQGIKAQLYAADGTKVGSEFLVNTETYASQLQPHVTALANGGFVVIWQGYNNSVGAYQVKAQAYGADGSPAGTEFLIDNTATYDQESSDITALENGNFVVTWREYNPVFNQDDLKARVYAPDGTPIGDEFKVNINTFLGNEKPSINSLAGGGFVVTWKNDVFVGNDYWGSPTYSPDVTGRVFGADAAAVTGEFTVSTVTSAEQRGVVVVGLADGGFVAVWYDTSGIGADTSGASIKAQLFAADGAKLGSEFVVNTITEGYQYLPEVASLADGGFVVAWEDNSQIGGDNQYSGIKAQLFDASGIKVGGEFLVNTNTNRYQSMPVIAVLENGNIVSAWADSSRVGGDTSEYAIKAQIFGFGEPAAPVIHSDGGGSSAAITVYEGITVATVVQADDEDVGDVVTYALSGADASLFTLDANTGALSFITTPDFDTPADAGSNNVYDVVVTASDGTLTDSQALAITVVDAPDIERVGGEITANTTTNGGQYNSAITALSNGNFVVTWSDRSGTEPDFDGAGIRAQLFSADGTKLGGEFLVNTVTEGEQYEPEVAGLAGGGYVIFWNSYSASAGYNTDVKAQIFNAGGTKVGGEFFLNTTTTDNQYNPKIAALADGGFVATWDTYNPATSGTDVRMQIFSADGTKVGAESLANTTTYHEQHYSDVTALADGGFLIVWQAYDTVSNAYNITAQRYAADGTHVGGEVLVNLASTSNHQRPSVAALENGGFVVTWSKGRSNYDYYDESPYEVQAQVFDASGAKVGGEISVKQSQNYAISYNEVIAVEGGNFLVTWTDYYLGGGDDEAGAVRAQLYSENGKKIGVEFLVNTTTSGDQNEPSITRLADGGFAISWSDYSYSDYNQNVKLQVFDVGLTSAAPPAITSDGGGATAALAVAENATAVTTVHAASSKALTYSLSGTDADLFTLDASTGALTFKAAPDFEAPGDGGADNVYDVVVTASDGTLSDTQAIAVTVTNANDAPTTPATAVFTITEDKPSAAISIGAADADGDALSYAIKVGAEPAHGTVSFADGAFVYTPDANANGNDSFTVVVSDGKGGFAEQVVSVTINPVNDAPVRNGPALVVTSTPEDNAVTISASDLTAVFFDAEGDELSVHDLVASSGSVTDNGDGTFTLTPDANFNGSITLDYTVSDGHGGQIATAATYNVEAVNDAPTNVLFTGTPNPVYEAAATGTLVGNLRGIDPDDLYPGPQPEEVTLSIFSDSTGGGFAFDGNELVVADGSKLVSATSPLVRLVIRATDAAGATFDKAFDIPILHVNKAPAITSNGGGATATVSLGENQTAANTVAASDPDAGSTLVYSISGGADAALFEIDSVTGALRFKIAPNFEAPGDAGANNVYDVIVAASDGTLTDTQTLAVTITDTNEVPVISSNGSGATATVRLDENSTSVTTVTASDPDAGTTLVYSISGGADAALFAIDAATGALRFKTAPNFEAAGDAGANNVYDVIVAASDGTLTDKQTLAITVADVVESTQIIGTAANNSLTGTAGADQIFGLGGIDRLTGLGGDDLLDGGTGIDTMIGGLGDDTYVVDILGDRVAELAGEGTDTVRTALVKYTLGKTVENLTFTGGTGHIGTGNALINHIIGAAGNDVLDGRGGADVLEGGLGSDTYYVDNIRDNVVEAAGTGTDSVIATVNFVLAANTENLLLRSSSTALNATGNDSDNMLIGNSYANVISGLGGNDMLIGGRGNDTLTGGAGADSFVFDTAPRARTNMDTVTDFVSGTDKLVLDQTIYTAFAATGAINASVFWSGAGVTAAHDADDRLIYNTTTGALFYDADGNGRGKAVQIALLEGNPALAFEDFLITA